MVRRGLLAAAGLYLTILAVHALVVWAALGSAQDDLRSISLDSIEQAGGIRPAVQPALDAVGRADAWISSPAVAPLRVVPVVGDQVDGVQAMVERLAAVADAGDDALDEVEAGLARTGEPRGRVALLDTALQAIDDVEGAVLALPAARTDGLLGPVRTAQARLDTELDELPERFDELRGHLRTTRELLDGPTRILLLAANNAEHRAGMGMHLSAGVITLEGGDFESSRFVPTVQVTAATEGRADVPEDVAALHGRIWDIGKEWRTTSTTPDFPTAGAIFDQLAELAPIGPVDMVVSLDVPALAMMLDATGPVEVDGELVTSENAVDLLLRDNYLRMGEESEANERRDLQSRIAGTIFDTVTERDLDIVDLAASLTRAAEGRHLMGWSEDPDVQALWEALGADGALTEDSFLVAAQNATASKRDYYLDPEVDLIPVGDPVDGRRRYRATLTLANPVVSPTAPYVDSLNRFVPVGVHRAYVTFTLPGSAERVDIVTGTPSGVGTDGPTVVAASWLRVPEGETRTTAVEFDLPDDLRRLDLVPGARVRPTTYRFGPRVEVTDAVPRRVPLPRVAALRPQEAQPLAAAALIAGLLGVMLLVNRSRRLEGPEPDLAAARSDARLAALVLAVAAVVGVLAGLA
ncbi:MAG TPA: DUF4012 domain-containing protein [Acidimicrobiales bacterium]|nr:DUF4012 domain-containing protein [Acidimicrobiales bacterium]